MGKIDNSSVLDGFGTGQTLPLWSGSGTSNTLTDSHITQNSALPNDIIIPQYIRHTATQILFLDFRKLIILLFKRIILTLLQ